MGYSPWGHKESDTAEGLSNNNDGFCGSRIGVAYLSDCVWDIQGSCCQAGPQSPEGLTGVDFHGWKIVAGSWLLAGFL